MSYQWTLNHANIGGATGPTLVLPATTTAQSGSYGVTVSNPYGATNSPTFSVTFSTPPDRYTSLIMNDNPMAYWRLDETNSTIAVDSAGGNNGTYSGTLTQGVGGAVPGIADFCVHFGGGVVKVPYTPVLNPNGPFSVEFWANPDNEPSATYTPMGSQYRSGSARDGWAFYDENDALSWELQLGNAHGVSHYAYGGGPRPFGGTWYYVCAVWDGVNTLSLYAENQLVGQNTSVANGGTYVPNAVNPLVIGQRNDGNYGFNGLMDEVAMYNYALTTDQISNHWSIKFQPPYVVTPPVGVTNVEGSTVTLSVVAGGFPNSYQWYNANGQLAPIANNDGTPHYPQDVTNSTLVIAQTVPSDSGTYYVAVSNPLGVTNTVPVNVLITPNTNPPTVLAVTGLGTPNYNGPSPYLVKVEFSKRVDYNTAIDPTKYSFNPAVNITGVQVPADDNTVTLGGDWREALIATAGLTPGQKYALTVGGIKDQATTPNTMATATTYFRAPVLTPGVVAWDYYYLGAPYSGVGNLMANPLFPSSPETNSYFTAFDSDQITGGDLNNNPAFGALGDNYGDSVSGWLTPTVSGDYYFFVASDDASQLDLSSDANPGNLSTIAYDTGCCHGFVEPTNNVTYATPSPITLVAG